MRLSRPEYAEIKKFEKNDTISHIVQFNTGGAREFISTQRVALNSTATKPTETPTKDGNTFKGWYKEDKQTAFNFNTEKITDDTIVYAVWEQKSSGGGGSSTPAKSVENPITYDKCTKDSKCSIAKFKDLELTAWYHDGIHFCLDEGLMNGISATTFNPNGNTSRAMMMTIVARMGGKKCDTLGSNWYLDGVNYVIANNISDGSRPTEMITREEFAVMLYKYAQKLNLGYQGAWMFMLPFADNAAISPDAVRCPCCGRASPAPPYGRRT